MVCFNTLRPRRNEHFADDIFKRIFFNENVRISIKVSLKFVPKVPINNIPALVQIMAWRHSGDKPLSEPMMVNLPTHICVTWPQWVKIICLGWYQSKSTNIEVQTTVYGMCESLYRDFIFATEYLYNGAYRYIIFDITWQCNVFNIIQIWLVWQCWRQWPCCKEVPLYVFQCRFLFVVLWYPTWVDNLKYKLYTFCVVSLCCFIHAILFTYCIPPCRGHCKM